MCTKLRGRERAKQGGRVCVVLGGGAKREGVRGCSSTANAICRPTSISGRVPHATLSVWTAPSLAPRLSHLQQPPHQRGKHHHHQPATWSNGPPPPWRRGVYTRRRCRCRPWAVACALQCPSLRRRRRCRRPCPLRARMVRWLFTHYTSTDTRIHPATHTQTPTPHIPNAAPQPCPQAPPRPR